MAVEFEGTVVEQVRGRLDQAGKHLQVAERKLALLEARASAETAAEGTSLVHWLAPAAGLPAEDAFPLDAATAAAARPCHGYALDPARPDHADLVYKHGLIGALSPAQQAEWCTAGIEVRQPTDRERRNLEAFRGSAHVCEAMLGDTPAGERLPGYLACMEQELAHRGYSLTGAALPSAPAPADEPALPADAPAPA